MSDYTPREYREITVRDTKTDHETWYKVGRLNVTRIYRPNDNLYQVTYASGRIRLFAPWRITGYVEILKTVAA